MKQEKQLTSLPENAYRELKPGEEYTPVMPASSNPKEVTPYSVTMGVVMAVVFSAAAAFLGSALRGIDRAQHTDLASRGAALLIAQTDGFGADAEITAVAPPAAPEPPL